MPQRILLQAGFYGVNRIGHIQYDNALITVMVKWWLQETHTFHLTVGKCSITLEDVTVLLGLLIVGHAVTTLPLDALSVDVYERVLNGGQILLAFTLVDCPLVVLLMATKYLNTIAKNSFQLPNNSSTAFCFAFHAFQYEIL
ncbi:hypothetical protein LguiA_013548 [Lonicera macranthoides]